MRSKKEVFITKNLTHENIHVKRWFIARGMEYIWHKRGKVWLRRVCKKIYNGIILSLFYSSCLNETQRITLYLICNNLLDDNKSNKIKLVEFSINFETN